TASGHEMLRGIDHVVDVRHAPLAVQAVAKTATVAGTAAVIDVAPPETARGPELHGRVEGRSRTAGGPAMHTEQHWRQGALECPTSRIDRGIVQRMRLLPVAGGIGKMLRHRNTVRRQFCLAVPAIQRGGPEWLLRIDGADRRRLVRCGRQKYRATVLPEHMFQCAETIEQHGLFVRLSV